MLGTVDVCVNHNDQEVTLPLLRGRAQSPRKKLVVQAET